MARTMIEVEGLGKCYRRGGQQRALSDLRESLLRAATWPFRKKRERAERDFWALRDVSFSVEQGDIVGIVGSNGAGKSTLLKILSRITRPTEGKAKLHGRVGSLLEVGTGFHPELTGRENVYFSGAVLGMREKEIKSQFDEIVDFSGVEEFIDTPVKHYSSGMRVRLGFAVAAHLNPEILLVDEVLAVGDAAFQKKCLGKMSEVAKGGRTVLFVSHNMAAVENLCSRTVVFDDGRLVLVADSSEAVHHYLASSHEVRKEGTSRSGEYDLRGVPRGKASGLVPVLESLVIRNVRGQPTAMIPCGESVSFDISYRHGGVLERPTVGIFLAHPTFGRVAFLQTLLQHGPLESLPASGHVICRVPRLLLVPGRYLLTLGVSTRGSQLDQIPDAIELLVASVDYFGTGQLPKKTNGVLLLDAEWNLKGDKLSVKG